MRTISITTVWLAALAMAAATFDLPPVRAQGQAAGPVLDILGIRPGMPIQDAFTLLSRDRPRCQGAGGAGQRPRAGCQAATRAPAIRTGPGIARTSCKHPSHCRRRSRSCGESAGT